MLTIVASGVQVATIGVEHTLTTLTGPGTFTLHVDTSEMAVGTTSDVLQVTIWENVVSGGTEHVAYRATFAGPQDNPIKISIPVPVPYTGRVTLRQTAGTARSYPWVVTTPD